MGLSSSSLRQSSVLMSKWHLPGLRIVIVFDAQRFSALKEPQREQVTELVEIVFACGGVG